MQPPKGTKALGSLAEVAQPLLLGQMVNTTFRKRGKILGGSNETIKKNDVEY